MKNQTKHTPGPWIVKNEDEDTILYGQRQWIHAIGQPWVAERIAILECDANSPDAALITAAPDMLQALKQIKRCLNFGQIDQAHARIDAAIAKAEVKL